MAALIEFTDPTATGAGNGNSPTDAYTAARTWESTEQQDLTDGGGDTMTCTCLASSGTADTTVMLIAGWTTGATNYIQIEAASTDKAVADGWDTAKYRFSVTDGTNIDFREDYVRLDGLQIESIAPTAAGRSILYYTTIAASNDHRVSNCRLRGGSHASNWQHLVDLEDSDVNVTIWNTIFEGLDNTLLGNYGTYGTGALIAYNCTIYGMHRGMRALTASNSTVINCAVFN
ncbi:hypothetical protein LCGC14_1629590, partial [marine sediment metagenome]